MPIFTSAVVTPTQGSLETAVTAYADANSAANTVAVYANSSIILTSANLNFNNTDSISVSVTPNTVNQANIAFSVRNRLGIGTNNPSANLHVIGNTLITTDLTVSGNLFVEGNTTTLNVQTLEVEDNDIVLNANTTGAPTLNATITIDRGTSTNTFLRWNEVTDRWGWSDNGTTFEAFEDLVKVSGDTMTGSLNVTAGGVNISAGGLAVTGGANVVSGGLAVTGGAVVSGNTNLDSGTLFVDSVNDRVGVSTTSPARKLDVQGGMRLLQDAAPTTGALVIRQNSGDTVGGIIQFVDNANAVEKGWIYFDTNGDLRIATLSAEKMRITSNGNVGIGTVSPSSKFDVNGLVSVKNGGGSEGGEIDFYNPDNTTVGMFVDVSTADVGRIFSTRNNFSLQLGQFGGTGGTITAYTAGSERIRIDSSGNVGIGTSSPTSNLHVIGSANFDTGNVLIGTAATFGKIAIANNSLGTTIDSTRDVLRLSTSTSNADHLDFFKLRDAAEAGLAWQTAGWRIQQKVDSTWMGWMQFNGSGLTGGISFGTGTSTTSPRTIAERMRLDSSGNLGIGTTSPGVRLDVSGTVRASSQLISTVATGTAPLAVSSTTVVTNLNADLLDGYQASSFVQRTNASDQVTLWDPYGQYYTAVWGVGNDFNNFVNSGSYHVDNAASNHASAGSYGYLRIWRHIGSNYLLQEFTPSGSAVSTWRRLGQDNGAGSRIWTGWSKYWSDGNDGAGSGLDADLLDGIQGSSFLRSDQSATNSVDLRSPNFYISADTNNRFGQGLLILRNTSPTVYFQDTDHNSAMLHCNSSLLYVLRGGNDTTSWSQVSGQWPFIFNLTNNDATCGGSFSAIGNVTAYSSDRRLKTNIQNIPNALDKVLSLNGVTFDWIDKVKEFGFTPDTMTNDAGVIAQEVQKVLPQAVKPAPFDHQWNNNENSYVSKSGEDFVTVQYEKIVPLLIEAIKELKKEIEDLKSNRNV